MKTVHDFNYKVALASGLKHLQAGRLRQAEEQFRYLVSKFPRADGGYRGLARVQIELGDRAAALGTLREGAVALSKAGDRIVAIGLLREAVTLDPLDLAAHRRLAAALSLAGDATGAGQEYVRFTQAELAAGDPERATLEAMYALETLGEIPALHELARSLGLGLRTVRAPVEAAESAPTAEAAWAAPAGVTSPEPPPFRAPIDERTALFGHAPAPAEPQVDERAALFGAPPDLPTQAEEPVEHARPMEAPVAQAPAPPTEQDALALEERAASLIARNDAQAGPAAIAAAAALFASGKTNAASDLLLQLVASGTAVHDAARELISVASALGRRDIATARAELLARVMRLAGEEERAAEVDRIGQTV